MAAPDIVFPNIGIELQNVDPVAFTVFGIEIYWYALFICTGILSGLGIASIIAKKTDQDPDIYSEFLIYALISAIVGARLYYVIFSWEQYKDNILDIFALRQGGLAIYGGVIGAVIAAFIYTRIKKLNFWVILDTGAAGLLIGQAIGRWGNFINREAFGGYTNNFFAMLIKESQTKYVPTEIPIISMNGVDYLQVHPTFLYESLWNIAILVLILLYFKHRKFNGEIFAMYLLGYGLGRVWIEGLRTDQLIIGNSNIAVSQLLAAVLIIISIIFIVVNRIRIGRKDNIHDSH